VHGGRLAGAVRAEEAVDLARLDLDVDAVDGPDALNWRTRPSTSIPLLAAAILEKLPVSATLEGTMNTAAVKEFTPPQMLEAWVAFLRSHAAITRELSAQLQREHGLTLNDYEVLLHLSYAEEGALRRVDLAERVILTASGITRLLDGLERCGYVDKAACESDARVTYAKITDAGLAKLRAASVTHLAGIDELFTSRYSGSELATLAELLSRLPATEADCTISASCA
jgi:DNA-binding MarR family transcriptional regulator